MPSSPSEGGKCYPGTYCPGGSEAPINCTEGMYCATERLALPTAFCNQGGWYVQKYRTSLKSLIDGKIIDLHSLMCPWYRCVVFQVTTVLSVHQLTAPLMAWLVTFAQWAIIVQQDLRLALLVTWATTLTVKATVLQAIVKYVMKVGSVFTERAMFYCAVWIFYLFKNHVNLYLFFNTFDSLFRYILWFTRTSRALW